MRHIRVCLIEDDEAFAYLTKIIIKSANDDVEVISFSDGAKAYDFFENNYVNMTLLPDVIFLDLNMPYMNGWEFLSAYDKIKEQIGIKIPIYILSSSISEQDIIKAEKNPLVNEFLSKPLEKEKVAEIFAYLNIH